MTSLWTILLVAASGPDVVDPVAHAVRAFESDRIVSAIGLARKVQERVDPQSDAAATARLVELFGLLKTGHVTESRKALDKVASLGPPLGAYGTLLGASAASVAHECEQAQQLAQTLGDSSIFRTPALSRVASCWLEQKAANSAHAAVDAMEAQAESESRRAEAALMRARVVESVDGARHARDAYRRVLVRFPLTEAGRRAATWLERAKRKGIRVSALSPAELLLRADDERDSFRPHVARKTYDAVIAASRGRRRAELRHAAELGLAQLDMVDRRYDAALRRIDEVLGQSGEAELLSHATYLRGDVLSRRGRTTDSLAAYELAMASYPLTAYAPEAALAAAQLAYHASDFDSARAYAQWMLVVDPKTDAVEIVSGDGAIHQGRAETELGNHALWLMAWSARRLSEPNEVVDSFLADIDSDSDLWPAALYWRARLANDDERPFDTGVFAEVLMGQVPASYYAFAITSLLSPSSPSSPSNPNAAARGRLTPGPNLKSTSVSTPKPTTPPQDLLAAETLYHHGLISEAQRIVRMVPANHLSSPDRALAAWLYHQNGDMFRSTVISRRIVRLQDPGLMQISFPRPFREIVDEMATTYNVPAPLLYAVMRQESSFNPNAISPRKARGLMQMIPTTAIRIADNTKQKRFRVQQLFDPKVSIRLGAAYLKGLLDQFDGNLVCTIASYHAGEQRVARWLQNFPELNEDEFVEEIPFTTTRDYIKKVLAAYGAYRFIYESDDPAALWRIADRRSVVSEH